MDMVTILIGVGVLVLVAIVVVLMMSKDKPAAVVSSADSSNAAEDKQDAQASNKRFKSVLSNDLQNQMKQEEQELLTKYTAGTGEGINEVEKLLASDPNNVDLLDWLAFMYYSNNEIDKAIDTYRRALAIKPNNENQHYYLANSYFKKTMQQEAVKEWNEVIRLKPNSKIAKNAQERIDFVSGSKK
ncbi:MAG: tetratricopeptide repeat protein [Candidatus Riflebacteria bacterium]|nr:tetratricopeptide repeat protein [Candidatus Riflebacteria bacterium]